MSIIILPNGFSTSHLYLIDGHYFADHSLLLCRGCGFVVSARGRRRDSNAYSNDLDAYSHEHGYRLAVARYFNGRAHHLPLAHTIGHIYLTAHPDPVQYVYRYGHLYPHSHRNTDRNANQYADGDAHPHINCHTHLHPYRYGNAHRDADGDAH